MQGNVHPTIVGFHFLPFLILIDHAGCVKTNQVGTCCMGKSSNQVSINIIKGQIRLFIGMYRSFLFNNSGACHRRQNAAHYTKNHQYCHHQANKTDKFFMLHCFSSSSLS